MPRSASRPPAAKTVQSVSGRDDDGEEKCDGDKRGDIQTPNACAAHLRGEETIGLAEASEDVDRAVTATDLAAPELVIFSDR